VDFGKFDQMANLKNKYTIVIPARKGSKGLPFKNRKLIGYTLRSIPEEFQDKIIIATNDEFLIKKYNSYNIFKRSEEVSSDTSSTKSLFLEMREYIRTENIIMLYLTYPERTFKHIERAIKFYEDNKAKSLLCSKKLRVSPFLMMYKSGVKGRQIVDHNLHRRQDYPECFELSHFISIFNRKELDKLNNNLYNKDTVFYSIEDIVDIDTSLDLENFNEKNKNNR